MFEPDRYRRMQDRILGPNSEPMTLLVNNGTGYDEIQVTGRPYRYQSTDLVEGGPIKLGDMRLIIDADSIPDGTRRLEAKDRVEVRGKRYGVIDWDDMTRSVGGQVLAINCTVRG